MKTETLQQAINYALEIPDVQKHIQSLEAIPDRFIIAQVSATVLNYGQNSIRVFINFRENGNPNNYKEDALIDIQGTNFSDFKILNIVAYQVAP